MHALTVKHTEYSEGGSHCVCLDKKESDRKAQHIKNIRAQFD